MTNVEENYTKCERCGMYVHVDYLKRHYLVYHSSGESAKKKRARLLGYPECCSGDDMPSNEELQSLAKVKT